MKKSIKKLEKKVIKNIKPVKGGNNGKWILFYDEADSTF